MAILLKGLLATILVLKKASTLVVLTELESALDQVDNPTVLNVGAAVIKLLNADSVAGSVILYILPKSVAEHVVDVDSLLVQLKAKNQPSLPLGTVVNVFGDYLVDVYSLKF